jgi:3-hydroxybutyryl-CoA dehydrogenase
MGRGIAEVVALSGRDVKLVDVDHATALAARAFIEQRFRRLHEKGRLDTDAFDAALSRLTAVDILEACASCDLVIEAVSESLSLKSSLLEKLDRICPPATLLASNTSSISITSLAAHTRRADKVIGIHFMNPVPVMGLVEIVRGLATSDATYEMACAWVASLSKQVVTSRDIPGFILNRILMPMLNEACFALFEGVATREDIDKGVTLGLRHPMGPLTLMDFIGLDTTLAILEILHRELGDDKYRPCPLLRQYVAAGYLGKKVGRGFYEYAQ